MTSTTEIQAATKQLLAKMQTDLQATEADHRYFNEKHIQELLNNTIPLRVPFKSRFKK